MNLVDLIIIAVVILTAVRGYAVGLLRQVLSLGGFIIGLFIAAWIVEHLSPHLPTGSLQPVVVSLMTLLIAVIIGGVLELGGVKAIARLHWHHGEWLNRSLGVVFGIVASLFSIWLIGIMLSHSPLLSLSQPVQRSQIIRGLDHVLPPTPTVLADIERLFTTHGFPEVFAGLEPYPVTAVAVPPPASVRAAAEADAASVVQIQGNGCGETVSGSGFVVSPGLVVTNAHVVAGIANPVVSDEQGTHPSQVVYFDPNLDLAFLRVFGLRDSPLVLISKSEPSGTGGAVLGYPGGGPYTAKASAILTQLTALGRNIYGQKLIARSIYEIQADVEPGNSGGPLTLPNGQVVGVVFARSTSTPDIGYALTGAAVAQRVAQFGHDTAPVSSGSCTE